MIDQKYIEEITRNTGRTFVIGDLHGELDKLYEAMERVDFNYDEDLIISVGDLVDRGPNSLECFNLIYKSWFKSVRGNHEQFCLDRMYGNTMASVHEGNGGEWFSRLPEDVQYKIADRVAQMPIILTLNKNDKRYGFVHGDIPLSIYDWDDLIEQLQGKHKESFSVNCLWGRTRIKQTMNMPMSMTVGRPEAIKNVDMIYLGHTVIKTDVVVNGNLHFIDTGATFGDFGFGKLTMIELK